MLNPETLAQAPSFTWTRNRGTANRWKLGLIMLIALTNWIILILWDLLKRCIPSLS